MQIYSDGTYLKNNASWDQEHSAYKAKEVCEMLADVSANTIFEVGCGAGMITKLLSLQYPDIQFVGYDISKNAANFWVGQESSNISFRCSDLLVSEERADVILCLDVFEHVSDYIGFLEKLSTHGSYFIFKIPMDMNVMKLMSRGLAYVRSDVGHLHYFNEWSAKATLLDCGYEIEVARLSPAFLNVLPDKLRQWLVLVPRIFAHFLLGRRLACKIFGGYGLMVRAKFSK
jgi:SAM-dependent methyltransferase